MFPILDKWLYLCRVIDMTTEYRKNMNRLLFAFSLLALFASCTGKYKINGESSVSSLDGKKLFLKAMRNGTMTAIDSAEVIHGLFSMKGKMDSVEMVMLYMDDASIMPIILEKGHISINIDNTQIKAKGTLLNDRLYSFFSKKNLLDERADELERKEAKMILDGDDPQNIQQHLIQEGEKLNQEMNALVKDFIIENYENVLGPGVFLMFNAPYPVMTPLMHDIYKDAPESFKKNQLVKEYVAGAKENERKLKGRN